MITILTTKPTFNNLLNAWERLTLHKDVYSMAYIPREWKRWMTDHELLDDDPQVSARWSLPWQYKDYLTKTDFKDYDQSISTALKTELKGDLWFLFAEPLPPNNFFVNLHRYFQLYYPCRFPKLHSETNKKWKLQGWQVKQDEEQWCNIITAYYCKYFDLVKEAATHFVKVTMNEVLCGPVYTANLTRWMMDTELNQNSWISGER